MNNILDKSLDSQFDKIENLTWFLGWGKVINVLNENS